MKRLHKLLGISTLGIAVVLPLLNNLPAVANTPNPVSIIAQAVQPEIVLDLAVARKATSVTVEGTEQVQWEDLGDNAAVAPGDVLRYTIEGNNTGKSPAENLAVTQPIPDRMSYQLNSAASDSNADITYSIDGGETFVAEPTINITLEDGTIEERPAPPQAYTHVRWNFPLVTPEVGATAMYEVQVQ